MRSLAFAAVLCVAAALLCIVPCASVAADAPQPVYLDLADSLSGSLDALTASTRAACAAAGWEVLATHDVSSGSAMRARVLVLHNSRYAADVLAHGPRAAFALPVRALLYEDERGTHLAMVNPMSIARTIVAESGFEAPAQSVVADLQRIARTIAPGHAALRGFGQVRTRGLIGRTMGVMAGGPFLGKVKDVYATAGATDADVSRVAAAVWKGVTQGAGRGRWQMRGVYRLDLAPQGVTVIGVSGPAMEAKSFAIVGAGGDAARSRLSCPGLAHAAAYPIEIVIFRDGGQVHVATIDAMYRMKLYFEDAGTMKFAANMTMPGSIEDEVRSLILRGVTATP